MYNRHNSGGQLLKTRQNEMFLTTRLFRPDEPIQFKQLRNQAGYLTDSRRFRPQDAESGQRKCKQAKYLQRIHCWKHLIDITLRFGYVNHIRTSNLWIRSLSLYWD
ncbi:hypothetical protein T09_136 [Trichinella sp. T9]|nr:hypothetical protein T09_136 [Trichinella sp. T9]